MGDPRRLRSESGSLGARLLRSAPRLEPPPRAQEEVWRRLQGATLGAAGTALGAALATRTAAAGSNIAGKTFWLAVLKWGAVVAIAAPTVGVAAHFARRPEAQGSEGPFATKSMVAVARAPATPRRPASAAEPAMKEAPPPAPASRPSQASALRAETLLLGAARAKLAAGDNRGALDDVARLEAQFPRGALVQEREVVAIRALAALGNRPGLTARASTFLQRFPDGPYSAHVRQILEP
jgi:hypothetical protein